MAKMKIPFELLSFSLLSCCAAKKRKTNDENKLLDN